MVQHSPLPAAPLNIYPLGTSEWLRKRGDLFVFTIRSPTANEMTTNATVERATAVCFGFHKQGTSGSNRTGPLPATTRSLFLKNLCVSDQ